MTSISGPLPGGNVESIGASEPRTDTGASASPQAAPEGAIVRGQGPAGGAMALLAGMQTQGAGSDAGLDPELAGAMRSAGELGEEQVVDLVDRALQASSGPEVADPDATLSAYRDLLLGDGSTLDPDVATTIDFEFAQAFRILDGNITHEAAQRLGERLLAGGDGASTAHLGPPLDQLDLSSLEASEYAEVSFMQFSTQDGEVGYEGDRTSRALQRMLGDDPRFKNVRIGGPTWDLDEPVTVFERGNQGLDVREMQQQLLKAGVELPGYGADGDYGRETEAGVQSFQERMGLFPTGTLDTRSLDALERMAGGQTADQLGAWFDDVLGDAESKGGIDDQTALHLAHIAAEHAKVADDPNAVLSRAEGLLFHEDVGLSPGFGERIDGLFFMTRSQIDMKAAENAVAFFKEAASAGSLPSGVDFEDFFVTDDSSDSYYVGYSVKEGCTFDEEAVSSALRDLAARDAGIKDLYVQHFPG